MKELDPDDYLDIDVESLSASARMVLELEKLATLNTGEETRNYGDNQCT